MIDLIDSNVRMVLCKREVKQIGGQVEAQCMSYKLS